MGFTTPCLIGKNTPELIIELKKIGYTLLGGSDECGRMIVCGTKYSNSDFYTCNLSDILRNIISISGYIRCYNENQFLSIASLRDDSDINQFFVCDVRLGSINYPESIIPKGSLMKCLTDKWLYPKNKFDSTGIPSHKATVQELIEHFK